MATPEQRKEELEKLIGSLSTLAQTDAESLARIDDLARDINFEKAVPAFERMLDVVRQLHERDLERLPHTELRKLNVACDKLSELIQQVRAFALTQENPSQACTNIINSIEQAYDGVMDPFLLPLAFTATQATDYARIEREAKGLHAEMQKQAGELEKFMAETRKDASAAMEAVREQAAEAGVATNAQVFLSQAATHSTAAEGWFKATIWVTVATVAVALFFVILSFFYQPATTAGSIQFVLSKIIFLSTLSFGIFWCARNYRAERHNKTLNKHRANALGTFRAFVEGTEDTQVRDAILLQAAQAAFVNRSTGYEVSDKELPPVNPVLGIVGKAIPGGGGGSGS